VAAVLPHKYPFQFVESRAGAAEIALTTGSPWFRDGGALPLSLAIEIMAQASHVLLGGAAGVFLAGVEEARILAQLGAGDRLVPSADLTGRFGQMIRVAARLHRDGQLVAQATLILVGMPQDD
jgi:3-hydroxymyristoyl/3-hydroxydecanoyl-(acyl carrier protein) dehydratase